MADETTQKKSEEPKREAFVVKGTDVLITRSGERETLQINGRVEGFYRTEDGYLLKRDVFHKPAKTLREAAERYLESEASR